MGKCLVRSDAGSMGKGHTKPHPLPCLAKFMEISSGYVSGDGDGDAGMYTEGGVTLGFPP